MKKLLTIIITLLCTSTFAQKYTVNVQNINEVKKITNGNCIYYLPKTALNVNVTATSYTEVKGPYAAYAQKYLGTDDIIKENSKVWKITNVEINSFPIKDSSRIYVVESTKPMSYNFTPEGFLSSINANEQNSQDYSSYLETHLDVSENTIKNDFKGLNINKFETVFDTVVHVVDADSVFTTVPTMKKQMYRKSIDEQAQELANQIFMIRDDRNALLSGDNQQIPSGEALKVMIENLNKLEESYMSMFIGKKIEQKKTYNFVFIPENKDYTQSILCKFSPQLGILPKTSLKGSPIMIETKSYKDNSQEIAFMENQEILRRKAKVKSDENQGFAYLSPARAEISILQENNSLISKTMLISQLGIVRYIPINAILNDSFQAIFYPQYGTLKKLF